MHEKKWFVLLPCNIWSGRSSMVLPAESSVMSSTAVTPNTGAKLNMFSYSPCPVSCAVSTCFYTEHVHNVGLFSNQVVTYYFSCELQCLSWTN
jgi:hypothetical protein